MERVKEALSKAREQRDRPASADEAASENDAVSMSATPATGQQNKLFTVLLCVNIVCILILVWYVSNLKSVLEDQGSTTSRTSLAPLSAPDTNTGLSASSMRAQQGESAVENAENKPIDELVAIEIGNIRAGSGTTNKTGAGSIVDVQYGDALIRMQVVGKLSGEDTAYLAALEELKLGSGNGTSPRVLTPVEAANIHTRDKASGESVDHFNKVIVEDSHGRRIAVNTLSFAEQIQQVVNAGNTKPAHVGSTDSYIQSLDEASLERKNETRIIRVKRGDSLWKLAERAYGDGFDYPRIFKANPHIINPDLIEEGDYLRVPI